MPCPRAGRSIDRPVLSVPRRSRSAVRVLRRGRPQRMVVCKTQGQDGFPAPVGSCHLCRGSRWHWSCSPFPTVPCNRWVMDDRSVIREKALRLAVRTGAAADVEFVWAAQRRECARECFGLFDQRCPSTCCWLDRCRVLSDEPIEAGWPSHTENGDRQTGETRGSHRGRWVPACTREVRGPRGRTPPL